MEPDFGFEPKTYRLQGDYSAVELIRRVARCFMTGPGLDNPNEKGMRLLIAFVQ